MGARVIKTLATRAFPSSTHDPWGWTVVLVVSEDIKEALERTGATGMTFTEC